MGASRAPKAFLCGRRYKQFGAISLSPHYLSQERGNFGSCCAFREILMLTDVTEMLPTHSIKQWNSPLLCLQLKQKADYSVYLQSPAPLHWKSCPQTNCKPLLWWRMALRKKEMGPSVSASKWHQKLQNTSNFNKTPAPLLLQGSAWVTLQGLIAKCNRNVINWNGDELQDTTDIC